MIRTSRIFAVCLALFAAWFAMEPVLAKPPPWAPAHGWRKKNDPFYVGYAGHEWSRDYGIVSGRCHTDTVLAAVGAAAGGVIGNRTASEGNRTVATIIGAVIGGVVGNAIGEKIDERDRACMGHSLELARVGQKVQWTNPATGLSYALTPTRNLADRCREFELQTNTGKKAKPNRMTACATPGGEWRFR